MKDNKFKVGDRIKLNEIANNTGVSAIYFYADVTLKELLFESYSPEAKKINNNLTELRGIIINRTANNCWSTMIEYENMTFFLNIYEEYMILDLKYYKNKNIKTILEND